MAEKVLSVNNLVINFKTDNGILKAVRDVSFDLYRGETLCIVGESGSGKSVTSKAIMGILANNAIIAGGNIIYRGENLLEVSEEEFYKIRGHKIGIMEQYVRWLGNIVLHWDWGSSKSIQPNVNASVIIMNRATASVC